MSSLQVHGGLSEADSMAQDEERTEQDKIWAAFMAYDHEQYGYISVNDLRAALERTGNPVTEDETYWMISVADP